MKKRVVVTDYTFPTLEREEAAARMAGAEFAAFQCKSAEEVVEAVQGATIAVVQFAPLTAKAIDGLTSEAAAIRYGIGFDNIDVAAAAKRRIPVGYVPDYCSDEVADHAASSLLACLRKLATLDASVRAGKWVAVQTAKPIKPFSDTLVGFFGLGQIGRNVLKRLAPFGFRFAASDPALDRAEAKTLGVDILDADTLFATADAISLHAPATSATIGFVNARRLATMKRHAVIVNTARGALIDEAALATSLRSGEIGGAALDVFQTEPLPDDSPLRNAPNLLLTPHVAWYSDTAIDRLQELAANDIANHLAGRPLRRPVPGSAI